MPSTIERWDYHEFLLTIGGPLIRKLADQSSDALPSSFVRCVGVS